MATPQVDVYSGQSHNDALVDSLIERVDVVLKQNQKLLTENARLINVHRQEIERLRNIIEAFREGNRIIRIISFALEAIGVIRI
ncbi:MAG: hypothetical protein HW387_1218 [Parachlamydiales bacterium]|nr:hypothetical protein [Parachlamydiales bacterium]